MSTAELCNSATDTEYLHNFKRWLEELMEEKYWKLLTKDTAFSSGNPSDASHWKLGELLSPQAYFNYALAGTMSDCMIPNMHGSTDDPHSFGQAAKAIKLLQDIIKSTRHTPTPPPTSQELHTNFMKYILKEVFLGLCLSVSQTLQSSRLILSAQLLTCHGSLS